MGIIVVICCTVYIYQVACRLMADLPNQAGNDWCSRNLVNSLKNVKEGRWWVMLTSSFAHANPLHLGINMLCLWRAGPLFIDAFGLPCFLGVWAVSAVSCSAAGIYWQNTQKRLQMETAGYRWSKSQEYKILGISISRERAVAIAGGSGPPGHQYEGGVGASGAFCGLTGAIVAFAPKAQVRIFGLAPSPLWVSQVLFLGGTAYCMATSSLPFVGHAGHLGGTAAGIFSYYGVMRPWLRRTGRI